MKNLLFLLSCCVSALLMSSCTADSIENEEPTIKSDDVSIPVVPVTPPPPIDHGGGLRDKDKG